MSESSRSRSRAQRPGPRPRLGVTYSVTCSGKGARQRPRLQIHSPHLTHRPPLPAFFAARPKQRQIGRLADAPLMYSRSPRNLLLGVLKNSSLVTSVLGSSSLSTMSLFPSTSSCPRSHFTIGSRSRVQRCRLFCRFAAPGSLCTHPLLLRSAPRDSFAARGAHRAHHEIITKTTPRRGDENPEREKRLLILLLQQRVGDVAEGSPFRFGLSRIHRP